MNLNDNDAMAQACGSGNTVVGWDDAGCGTSKCVCSPFLFLTEGFATYLTRCLALQKTSLLSG